jgi:hypothetical protein
VNSGPVAGIVSGRPSPDSRICIVGAGPAGLSAACYLRDRGYSSVILLERESQPGGKCLSFRCKECIVEMGAVFATNAYDVTLDLMDRVGIKPARSKASSRSKIDRALIERGYFPMEYALPGYFSRIEALRLGWEILKYRLLSRRYRRLYNPGLSDLPGDLHDPFSAWVKKYRMSKFAKMIEIPCTTFGYGYFDEIPAAYVLKYMDVPTISSLIFQKRFFHWEEGAQLLWKKLAAGFDVRYDTSPKRIRRGEIISVDIGSGRLEFDILILAAPLDESLIYLDCTSGERELFSRIKYYDYYVYSCVIEDLPISGGFMPANFSRDRCGHIMIWSQRSVEQNLYTFYTLGNGLMGDPEIREILRSEIEGMGGSLKKIQAFKKWKYFPHIDSAEMKAGYYERLEGMQGQLNTYYAGELMNFSTIELSARYSKDLVERFF